MGSLRTPVFVKGGTERLLQGSVCGRGKAFVERLLHALPGSGLLLEVP